MYLVWDEIAIGVVNARCKSQPLFNRQRTAGAMGATGATGATFRLGGGATGATGAMGATANGFVPSINGNVSGMNGRGSGASNPASFNVFNESVVLWARCFILITLMTEEVM